MVIISVSTSQSSVKLKKIGLKCSFSQWLSLVFLLFAHLSKSASNNALTLPPLAAWFYCCTFQSRCASIIPLCLFVLKGRCVRLWWPEVYDLMFCHFLLPHTVSLWSSSELVGMSEWMCSSLPFMSHGCLLTQPLFQNKLVVEVFCRNVHSFIQTKYPDL